MWSIWCWRELIYICVTDPSLCSHALLLLFGSCVCVCVCIFFLFSLLECFSSFIPRRNVPLDFYLMPLRQSRVSQPVFSENKAKAKSVMAAEVRAAEGSSHFPISAYFCESSRRNYFLRDSLCGPRSRYTDPPPPPPPPMVKHSGYNSTLSIAVIEDEWSFISTAPSHREGKVQIGDISASKVTGYGLKTMVRVLAYVPPSSYLFVRYCFVWSFTIISLFITPSRRRWKIAVCLSLVIVSVNLCYFNRQRYDSKCHFFRKGLQLTVVE